MPLSQAELIFCIVSGVVFVANVILLAVMAISKAVRVAKKK